MDPNNMFDHRVPKNLNGPIVRAKIHRGEQLKRFVSYGTRASAIYKDGCDAFDWKFNLSGHFGPQQLLYARFATPKPEEFSVWFICHNDAYESEEKFSERKRWNFIHENDIVEVDNDAREAGIVPYPENERRLVFVKIKSGLYVYYGVFKCTYADVDKKTGALTRVFTREPDYDVYPIERT